MVSAYFVIPLLFLFASIVTSLNVSNSLCIQEERVALLKVKESLKDPGNCLSSWVGKDCCNWTGIECDNHTGHVLKLDIHYYSLICAHKPSWLPLGGEINPSLADLKHLTHLDLGSNNFEGIPIPEFIGSLKMLHYLDLSRANFSGMVPTHLGKLSNLQTLDISSTLSPLSLWVRDLSWLSALSSLQYRHMDFVNINNTPHELFGAVNKMPSLLELHLSSCNLASLPSSFPFSNITSLSVLHLSGNDFNSSIPSWLFNMNSLTELHLFSSSLRGPVPSMLGRWNLCNLQSLFLLNNSLTGDITEMIEALSCSNQSLALLDLSNNQLNGKLPDTLGRFNSLYKIDLSRNSVNTVTGVSGPIPASIGNLSNLGSLNLQGNMMNRTIPESIGQLTNLYSLNLLENYWEGTMTNIHFHNLTSLSRFSMSSKKKSFALKVTKDWVPPFENLDHVEIRDCQVGPTFPNWLRDQKTFFGRNIILENGGIIGEIPRWLYNISSQIQILDLSHNNISGYIPKEMNFSSSYFVTVDFSFNQLKGLVPLWSGVKYLYLRNNLLSGTIPANIGREMSHLSDLDLSNNYLNGKIPLSLNTIRNLSYIDLSNNYLTGEIPEFWMGM